jgi:AsmA protein
MPVWIRRTLLALAALLAVLLLAAAWLISSFDPNRYKGVAIDWMKTERNRTLAIDGPIELSVFPRLALRLSGVRLSEVGRAEEFAAVERAALSVDVLPLLRRELVVDRIEASGVRAVLLRDAQGRRNTDDLAGKPAPPPSPAGTAASAPAAAALRFDVSRIELSDLRLRVKDQPAALEGELHVATLRTGRLANGIESPVELRASLAFKSPAAQGSVSGTTRLRPNLDNGSIALTDMDLVFKGDVPAASAVDASLKGSLAWDGSKGALEAKSLALKLGAKAGGIEFAGTTLGIDRFAYDPTRQALAVAKLVLRVKGQRGGAPVALELDWPQLDVQGDKLSGSALTGNVSLAGATPLQASFKSDPPSGSFDALSLPGFEARISSSAAQRKIEGTLRSRIALRPAQRSLTLDALALQATVTDPGLKPLSLAARGTVTASAEAASWSLAGQLNDNRFDIGGNAKLSGSTPSIKAQASFDSLDLNTLFAEAGAAGKTVPGAPAPADTPVDLSALRSVNAQIGLRAGTLAVRQYRVTAARVDAVLDAGVLRVNTLQGKAWGGTLDATAVADARASRIAVKGSATGVNVNTLLKEVAGKDVLEGTGRVSVDVDTAGRSVGELRSRLRGNAALQLRDGAVKGVNLAKSLRQAKAALSLRQDATQKASQVEKTDFSELSASFQIDNGVARSKDLDVKSPFLRLGGEGAADIGKGTLDYTARATITGAPTGQEGADLAALKGLTVPVRLTGPFEAVEWKIQWSAVAGDVLRNKAEDTLKEKLGLKPASPSAGAASAPPSPKDALKEKLLKGLFK